MDCERTATTSAHRLACSDDDDGGNVVSSLRYTFVVYILYMAMRAILLYSYTDLSNPKSDFARFARYSFIYGCSDFAAASWSKYVHNKLGTNRGESKSKRARGLPFWRVRNNVWRLLQSAALALAIVKAVVVSCCCCAAINCDRLLGAVYNLQIRKGLLRIVTSAVFFCGIYLNFVIPHTTHKTSMFVIILVYFASDLYGFSLELSHCNDATRKELSDHQHADTIALTFMVYLGADTLFPSW